MTHVKFLPLSGKFGVQALDLDLRRDAGPALVRDLAAHLFEHRILVIPGQELTNDDYTTFGRLWGRPILIFKKDHRVESHPEMVRQSNSAMTPVYMRNNASHWHSDSTYEAESATITMLYGVESPEKGGETLFSDLVAAYDALNADMKRRLDGLEARHRPGGGAITADETIVRQESLTKEQRETFVPLPSVTHPIVMRHPVSKRLALYGISGSAYEIVGMSPEAGAQLLAELKQHAVQDKFRQSYKLSPGDVLIWDNLSVIHRATRLEYSDEPGKRRLNYRISVKGLPQSF
jgi:alpha-ketoglutarate-dependent taurine dioxygenase